MHVRDGTFFLLDGEEPKGLDKALHQQTNAQKERNASSRRNVKRERGLALLAWSLSKIECVSRCLHAQ